MTSNNNNGKSTSTTRARYWVATINDADDGSSWSPPQHLDIPTWAGVQLVKGQKETAPSTGRAHWQLFIAFKQSVRRSAVVKLLPRSFCEPSRSQAAESYVHKDETAIAGTRFELGTKALSRNSATDWSKIKDLAKAGQIDDVPPDVFIQHYRTLKQISMDFMKKPNDLPDVCGIWIHGPPGVGKSHFARTYPGPVYSKMCNKWWCGYQGERTILMDDLDNNKLGHHLKIWADKYAFIAETKGYAVTIRPDRIIVTSNYSIEELFAQDPVLAAAVRRRFYIIYLPLRMH